MLVLLLTVIAGETSYRTVRERVRGELSALTLAQYTIYDLSATSDRVMRLASDLTDRLNDTNPGEQIDDSVLQQRRADRNRVLLQLREISESSHTQAVAASHQLQIARNLAKPQAANGGQIGTASTQFYDALGGLQEVVARTITTTKALTNSVQSIQEKAELFELAALQAELAPLSLRLTQNARYVQVSAHLAADSMDAIENDGLAVFMSIGVLFVFLVLFPWLVLMLFLYRKRSSRAVQILNDLLVLDPTYGLISNVVNSEPNLNRRNDQVQSLRHLWNMDIQRRGVTSARNRAVSSPQDSQKGLAVEPTQVTSTVNPVGGTSKGSQPTPPDQRGPQDSKLMHYRNRIAEGLARQAFSNFEYVLTLLFVSALSAIGWFYIFYPQDSIGLAALIKDGGGIRQLTDFIVNNLTPVTAGFMGGYFFLLYMLLRRYLSDDLYPSAFLQVGQRLLLVFILGLLFSLITPILQIGANGQIAFIADTTTGVVNTLGGNSGEVTPTPTVGAGTTDGSSESTPQDDAEASPAVSPTPTNDVSDEDVRTQLRSTADQTVSIFVMLAAFIAGLVPTWAVNLIRTRVGKAFGKKVPPIESLSPLTRLDGIDIWVEARLLEEKVTDVQGMATAAIEQLVLGTHYPTSQLVDWIDQAILYSHAGHRGEWSPRFRLAGIRTATDLLGAVGYDVLGELSSEPADPNKLTFDDLCEAINNARTAQGTAGDGNTGTDRDPDDPGPMTGLMTVQILTAITSALWPDPNLMYVRNFYRHFYTGHLNIHRRTTDGASGVTPPAGGNPNPPAGGNPNPPAGGNPNPPAGGNPNPPDGTGR